MKAEDIGHAICKGLDEIELQWSCDEGPYPFRDVVGVAARLSGTVEDEDGNETEFIITIETEQ